jgi:hypothetical protein
MPHQTPDLGLWPHFGHTPSGSRLNHVSPLSTVRGNLIAAFPTLPVAHCTTRYLRADTGALTMDQPPLSSAPLGGPNPVTLPPEQVRRAPNQPIPHWSHGASRSSAIAEHSLSLSGDRTEHNTHISAPGRCGLLPAWPERGLATDGERSAGSLVVAQRLRPDIHSQPFARNCNPAM